jgi:hypothetical protein
MSFQEQVKSELRQAAAAVPYADPAGIEYIRLRRDQRRRVRYSGWAIVSLLLVVGVLTVNLRAGPTDTPVVDSQPSAELSRGVVEVPVSHPAQQLLDEAATFGAFNRRASETLVAGSNVDFWACGRSGVGVCYIIADGIVAVTAFDAPRDAVAIVTGPGVDGNVIIPLNTEQLLGVVSDSTEIRISVLDTFGHELIQVGTF